MGLMWVAIEATTLVSVFMIMLYTNQGAMDAAWKYLMVATIGLSLALLGIVLFYANTNVPSAAASGSGLDSTAWPRTRNSSTRGSSRLPSCSSSSALDQAAWPRCTRGCPTRTSKAPTPVSALLSGVLHLELRGSTAS